MKRLLGPILPPGAPLGPPLLGLDVGSVAVGLVLLSRDGELLAWRYGFHQGQVRPTVRRLLAELGAEGPLLPAATQSAEGLLAGARLFDGQLCALAAVRRLHDRPSSLLVVGGERFGLATFDPQGGFLGYKSNSSCAAGTGSFLDQQARRLGLAGAAELAELAQANRGPVPAIASRCSVFAKTDLSHAQASGCTLEAICDGLALGLARNVADTVRGGSRRLPEPAVFAGGVSRNPAVVRHLETLLGCRLEVDEHSHLYGAIGACLLAAEDGQAPAEARPPEVPEALKARSYTHAPLELSLSSYPDFSSGECRLFEPCVVEGAAPVEVELYDELGEGILGVDVGSTSTKAVLLSPDRRVLAGFYTRTAGRPLTAVRALLEALEAAGGGRAPSLRGVATTGAGRKYVGQVIGADLMLNEITAHARAAVELRADTDTIIEIGGQDSKFTALRDGRVTFAQMNTVCAAGTGSFLEEQAARLGVPLADYARRAEGAPAPLTSDRCTVFMERDINHYLADKYSVEEMLAAALHAVCDNYLLKVASEPLIGRTVCFQGATARNRALVAVFECRLGRPIFVSRYCHLTGALGAALSLAGSPPAHSRFRGVGLYREEIPVRTEVCALCANHCRLSLAEVQGQIVAYGFQCGRDYQTQRFVRRGPAGLDLLAARRALLERQGSGRAAAPAAAVPAAAFRIGLPAALHLFDELPMWERFFAALGLPTESSAGLAEGVARGKEIEGAEFCAPVAALHGHVRHLAGRCDAVFLPVYLHSPDGGEGEPRSYCYYTQFAPAVVSLAESGGWRDKCLLPLLDPAHPGRSARELWRALRGPAAAAGLRLTLRRTAAAYWEALAWRRATRRSLRASGDGSPGSGNGDIRVLLLGRPYVVLDPSMNKGIPEILAGLGVRTCFQDMLPPDSVPELEGLRKAFPWHFAREILAAAARCARTPGLYPVLVTSFKCSPDAFVAEYFKRLLDAHRKPYLILQIDEHASNVGYETRLEAGLDSFRNHCAAEAAAVSSAHLRLPEVRHRLDGRTLLLPNWDRLSIPLMAAAMRRRGFDARVLEEDEQSIRRAMRWNTGQCIPLNAIVQDFADYVERRGLDPARTALWMPGIAWACNIPLFPHYMSSLLERYGGGLERAMVYSGRILNEDLSPKLALDTALAFHLGGLLRRAGCRLRPYETERGATDRAIGEGLEAFRAVLEGEQPLEPVLAEVMDRFRAIPQAGDPRPKVAIFGDLYVRDNDVMNQGLIRTIEAAGGEAVTTPFSDYLLITAQSGFLRTRQEGRYLELLAQRSLLAAGERLERRLHRHYREYMLPVDSFRNPHLAEDLAAFNLKPEQSGESFDNVLKIVHLLRVHPGIALFVQANPAFCCPSLVTEGMARHIERVTGVPVVTLTYDGTGTFQNDRLLPYLKYPRPRGERD